MQNSYKIVAPPPEPYTSEWVLCNYFEPWTPETMQIAIRKNFQWDISEWTSGIVDHVAEQFLNWAKTQRPDLHKELSTSEGKRWIKDNIKSMMRSIK